MKILCVVGARPNFMKIAPIISAIKSYNAGSPVPSSNLGNGKVDHFLVHTGQHYDKAMSESFFEDLNIPKPDIFLGVGSGTHANQTAEIMKCFEPVLLNERPDVVIVVGDVNSTVGCALVASKIEYENGKRPAVAHVEAGLRSFDRTMPEEVNRVITDHISDLLFVTERSGVKNLISEGLPEEKIFFVGNTMIDTLLRSRELAMQSDVLQRLNVADIRQGNGDALPYALLTLHRPSNVDNKETFLEILKALKTISQEIPIIFPVHPRTRSRFMAFNIEDDFIFDCEAPPLANENSFPHNALRTTHSAPPLAGGIFVTGPLGYLDFLCLMSKAKLVLTDSGGIQEETTCLGVPCVTIRENTERPVTTTDGTNVLSGSKADDIIKGAYQQLSRKFEQKMPHLWDGNAAVRIVETILSHHKE